MALSITELDLQSTQYLPAREVMTSLGGQHAVDGPEDNTLAGGILNEVNVQDVLSDNYVSDIQVSLVNVHVDNVQGALDIASANQDALTNFGY